MHKIETLFERDGQGKAFMAIDRVAKGCEWVAAGEGVATRKWDGTCCLVRDGKLYKRIDWSAEKGNPPASWFHHSGDVNQRSGHGWMPVGDDPGDTWHRDAWSRQSDLPNGTYELCGPRINKNPEGFEVHTLVPHGKHEILNAPRTFAELREFLRDFPHEGIVWHHPDGRMVKIKRRDFHKGR